MTPAARRRAVRREPTAAERIPYRTHVAPTVLRTESGDYVQAFKLGGASFESRDDVELNQWHERLNVLWRNIAAPNVALWSHVVRRRASVDPPAADPPPAGFAAQLHAKYRRRLAQETLMSNELYLALVYRPVAGSAEGLLARLLVRAQRDGDHRQRGDALDVCDKLARTVSASLARYEPEPLGSYRSRGCWFSSLLEYLGLLTDGAWRPMPMPRAPVHQTLAGARLLFGTETIEYRSSTGTRVGAMLGIKEYPTPTTVGMFDALLSAPFSFVLTQSFAFLAKPGAQSLLQRQVNRMHNAGDFALSQAAELSEALDALTSNEFVMGDHHFSLQVMEDIDEAPGGAGERLRSLNERVAVARSMLADTGMLVAREDLALEAGFWAQLPANFAYRPRKAPITSRNFAAMVPFHNFPAGRARGNHWGEALTLLITSARSPYHFSLHASDPADPEGGSRKDTGHTLICGPTGSGKTVLIGFLVAMLARQGATQVVFDKDRGLEILVRGLGGDYLPLKSGAATGFNPLQLPITPANVEFLKGWLRQLSTAGIEAPARPAAAVRDESELDQALRGTLALDAPSRRLSRLVEFLDPTDPEGLHARLARWCVSCRGEDAWAFDNPRDTLAARLNGHAIVGFDVTEFLDHPRTRAPVTSYLFHLVRQLLDGRRLVCWMDEFWRLLADRAFEGFAKDGPKTWRKLNAVMCLATQSPSDVLESPISRTLVEQTPTKIFFPNADADVGEYTQGFGLTEREFALLNRTIEPGSRKFLVKQGRYSVVCQLDLKGFEQELAVISGRAGNLARMQESIAARGEDPRAWLPAFLATIRRE